MHHALLLVGSDRDALYQAALIEAARALAPTLKHAEHHPDFHLLDNEEKEIQIGQIRQWRREASLIPNEAACHVFVMRDAETMNPNAQNALLALLEEPPVPCLFLLLCQNAEALLQTVRSRCQLRHLHTPQETGFPPEAIVWSGSVCRALLKGDELALLAALLTGEKTPNQELCIWLEALLAQAYGLRGKVTHLTGVSFFTTIDKIRQARMSLDSDVGSGHVLASLAVRLAGEFA